MSRLDYCIQRLKAQKTCLEMAAKLITSVPGPLWELGLGNGRSYDHLREILPKRTIYVFDREMAAHPTCVPPDDYMILGDLYETLPKALQLVGEPAALIHCDLGTRDPVSTLRLSEFVGRTLGQVVRPGGIVVSDQPLPLLQAKPLSTPDDAPKGYYYLYEPLPSVVPVA